MTESVRNVDQTRRRFVGLLAGAGAGAAVFGRALVCDRGRRAEGDRRHGEAGGVDLGRRLHRRANGR